MPKKHGRGGRGGARGRGRGRGRGGFSGRGSSRGRFYKRGRGDPSSLHDKRPNTNGPRFNDDILMHDLGGGDSLYLPPESSMKATARRTRRRPRMQDEAFNTEENRDSTMRLPLRQRPLEFVKADSYDPTKDIIQGLRKKEQERVTEVQTAIDDTSEVAVVTTEVEATEEVMDHSGSESEGDQVEPESDDSTPEHTAPSLAEEELLMSPPKKPKVDPLASIPDDQLFFIDEKPSTGKKIRTVEVEPLPPVQSGPNTEFTPTLTFGHLQLTTTQNDNGESVTSLPKNPPKGQSIQDFDPDHDALVTPEFDELENKMLNGGTEMYKSYQKYLERVMGNVFADSDEEDDDDEEDDVEIPEQEIYDELDDDFEDEARFIAGVDDDDDDDDEDNVTPEDENTRNLGKLQLEEEGEDSDGPEYGFLEEDYESFDNSLVEVINIRYGSTSNQYHIKSFRLTGTYDHQWVDQELFEDFLLENGMPEHRLGAYFKYIKGLLTPPEEEEKSYDDIAFDDTSDEEESDDDVLGDSDMEGLDDLIQYTKKYDGQRDMEVEPTRTLKTKGKGKKKELDLEGVSSELHDRLQEQWALKREGKKARKARKEQTIANEHAKSKDLLLKYPYTLHVKDIRNEFEDFLNDSKRNALTFPPMDPHGIKVVQKFAYLYNMKSRKFGKGLTSHAVAVKNKRTFRSLPDYHSIQMLMKQRPMFNRIDQKRPRSEVEAEKSSRRGNPSKAHVKEGDIVGADAPEISSDNIGRKLLMKMGWKSGQGLGLENRGIPEPVVAKVKKTKIGIR